MAYKMKGWSGYQSSPAKQKATYETSAEEHAKQNPYWYKINGKRVPKHVYNKYKTDPAKDELGKQTNDPDPAGLKAKRAADRAKLPKRPTVLTEEQMKNKPK